MNKKHFIHTDEMIEFIVEHNKGTSAKDLAEMFNERFGTNRTANDMKVFRRNHRLKSGLTGHFPKGHVPYTKGKKWDEYLSKEAQANSRKTCFRKGQLPQNTAPIGTEIVDRDGYTRVKVTDENGNGMSRFNWKFKQRIIWEKHYGPIPDDHMIIFLDGDKSNLDISNLACVSQAENIRLNQYGFRFGDDPEMTKAGLSLIKIDEKIREGNKKNQRKNQKKKQKK